MHPPSIYPQHPHLYNHGLAILACITPFRNMRPPPVYPQSWPCHYMSSHLKRKFLNKWIFSSNIIKTPDILKRWGIDKKREKNIEKRRKRRKRKKVEEKEKLQVSLQIRGSQYSQRRKKHFNFKNLLLMWFSPPSSYHFKKPFPKSLRKFSELFLDHPLGLQYTWLVLYPFSLPMTSTYLAFPAYDETKHLLSQSDEPHTKKSARVPNVEEP
jgi:hypothetical protein